MDQLGPFDKYDTVHHLIRENGLRSRSAKNLKDHDTRLLFDDYYPQGPKQINRLKLKRRNLFVS